MAKAPAFARGVRRQAEGADAPALAAHGPRMEEAAAATQVVVPVAPAAGRAPDQVIFVLGQADETRGHPLPKR